jgi:hypothetical protein
VVEDHGIAWFIEKRIIDRLPEQGAELEIHMGDHGAWRIGIEPAPGDGQGELPKRWFPPADPYVLAYRTDAGESDGSPS